VAQRFANLALVCVHKEYPNHISHTLNSDADAAPGILKNGYSTMPAIANEPIPVASAITTKKLNAPRRLASIILPNHVTSHQETRKIEVRYECRR
jgi:hypothetical protein